MALPPVAEHAPADVQHAAAQQAQKRKRRRTTAGGANDDCFSCRKGSIKCGRERPYCSQCMHAGTQCGGYKTTLTWGVGVASRGKLRGLSCPVANKNADGSDVSPTEMDARRRKNSMSKIKREEGTTAPMPMTAIRPHQSTPTSDPSLAHSYPNHQSNTLPIPIPQSNHVWQIPGYFEHVQQRQHDNSRHASFSHAPHQRPLHRIQTAFGTNWDGLSIPDSARSVDSFGDHELHSPLEFSQMPRSMSLFDRLPTLMEGFGEPSLTPGSLDDYRFDRHGSVDHYNDPLSGSLDSLSNGSYAERGLTGEPSPLDAALFSSNERSYDPFDSYAAQQQDDSPPRSDGLGMSLMENRFSSPFFHLSPRMQSLLDYYDMNVCPYLVAFDDAQNPYRKYVLQLATQNRCLQNAIAALATNNLRMRRKESRGAGFVEEITDAFDSIRVNDFNDASPEESLYKQMSIDQLNVQLTDPRAAQDDSVLATLLILCLFHVCDSGFSKFKTQLAGMQKLLSLRDPNAHTDFTRWVEMFFIWFDVMTSTVNDRELQIRGDSLDMLDYTTNLGPMEQFSGCDGRLFKLLANLGRVNLLAQGRAVTPNNGVQEHGSPFASVGPNVKPERKDSSAIRYPFNRTYSGLDYENLDGNGWGTRIVPTDEEVIIDEEIIAPDERREFWSEWYDMRTRLQSWQIDMSSLPTPTGEAADPAVIEAGHRDMMHINESFRYSALIYLERLGHPILPSSHYQFQHLVSQALYHITQMPVTSCMNKFLLWPLFIIGTECVEEAHRNIIRTRCIEVQKESGFFNNIAALEVLEKVWQDVGSHMEGRETEEMKARMQDNAPSSGGRFGQAFRWRRAMDRAGGEYIVV